MYRGGDIILTARRYLPMAICLAFFVWIFVNITIGVADWILMAALGFSILLFVVVKRDKHRPQHPQSV